MGYRITIFLLLLLAMVSPALSTTYYVRADGDNTNDGLSDNSGGAWETIQKAADTLVGGDTVTVRAGIYDESVTENTHGSDGNRIVYNLDSGASVSQWNLASSEYVTVNGGTVTNYGRTVTGNAIIADGSQHLILDGITIERVTGAGVDANSGFPQHLTVRNCTIDRCAWDGTYVAAAGGNAMVFVGHYLLFEGNSVSNCSDVVSVPDCSFVVIRNNTFGPFTRSLWVDPTGSGPHIDMMETYTANGTIVCYQILFEGNYSFENGVDDSHVLLFQNDAEAAGAINSGHIVRYNRSKDFGSFAWECRDTSDCSFYNNTFYNISNTSSQSTIASVWDTTNTPAANRNCIAVNNIWDECNPLGVRIYYDDGGDNTPADWLPDYGRLYSTAGVIWGITGANQDTGDPLLLADLTISNNSPAIDQGGPLASAAGAGVASTTLVIDRADAFCDGWGIVGVDADWIAVGSVDNVAQISSIDYSTDTLTLATPLTWSNSDPVWLCKKSDGQQVLYGSAPDQGAYEYNNQISRTPSSARRAGAAE